MTKDMSEEKEVKSFKCKHLTIEQGAGNFECSECYAEKLEQENKTLESRLKESQDLCGQKHDKMLEFQQRLSQAEAEIKDRADCERSLTEWNCKLDERLSTLLKASEGLEVQLEAMIEMVHSEYCSGKCDKWHGEADKALAEFRAVKK